LGIAKIGKIAKSDDCKPAQAGTRKIFDKSAVSNQHSAKAAPAVISETSPSDIAGKSSRGDVRLAGCAILLKKERLAGVGKVIAHDNGLAGVPPDAYKKA